MFVDAIEIVRQTVFPIFRVTPIDASKECREVVGTGFFINDSGVFLTAAHVFDATPNGARHVFWGYLQDSVVNPDVTISEIARDDVKDISVCRVPLATPRFLKLAAKRPPAGKAVCTIGYPLPSIGWDAASNQWQLGDVRRYVQPSFVLDNKWVMTVTNGQGVIRKHEGFVVRDYGLYGMSGGPVVDVSGTVQGVFASVSNPRKSTNGAATIEVQNGCAIASDVVQTFLKDKNVKFDITP